MNDRLATDVLLAQTPPASEKPLLQTEGVYFAYKDAHPILQGVTLTLAAGEVLALLGVNGAGKSTLIRLLLGFEKPDAGSILIDDHPLASFHRRDLAKIIAYVPQAHAAPFPYSVMDVVLLGRIAHGGLLRAPSRRDREAAASAIERLGIAALSDRAYTTISGGERQLVLIARALAQEARILIMDEPASGLDYGNQVRLLQHMRSLASEGYAILKSTHHPDHVLLGADRAALLIDGRICATGTPREVLTQESLARLYGVEVDFLHHADGRTGILPRMNANAFRAE